MDGYIPTGNAGVADLSHIKTTIGSVLFLFSPRGMVAHFKRPTQYNFNLNTVQTVTEELTKGAAFINPTSLSKHPAFATAMTPSGTGFHVATEEFSNYWTFMLIYEETNPINLVNNLQADKSVAMGVCMEEPISEARMGSTVPEQFLNPNCQLLITKVLGFKRTGSLGLTGEESRTTNTVDANIVHAIPNLWDQAGDNVYALTPGQVACNADVITEQEMGQASTSVLPNVEQSIQAVHKDYIDTMHEAPQRHMRNILEHFQGTIQGNEFNQTSGTSFTDYSGLIGDGAANFETNLKSDFFEGENAFRHIVDISTPLATMNYVTIGMLQTSYHPKVSVCNVPKGIEGNVMPQDMGTIEGVFSSLVCSSAPAYINDMGLCKLSFTYNSFHDAIQIHDASTLHQLTQEQVVHKTNATLFLFKTELFPILYENGGHFELSLTCQLNSSTICRLNYLDNNPLPDDVIYREETMLGGIVSPLVGTTDHLSHNAQQLNALSRNIAEVIYHKNNGY